MNANGAAKVFDMPSSQRYGFAHRQQQRQEQQKDWRRN